MTGTKYKCPKCENTITVFVPLSEPPVCNGKHIKGGVTMTQVKEITNGQES